MPTVVRIHYLPPRSEHISGRRAPLQIVDRPQIARSSIAAVPKAFATASRSIRRTSTRTERSDTIVPLQQCGTTDFGLGNSTDVIPPNLVTPVGRSGTPKLYNRAGSREQQPVAGGPGARRSRAPRSAAGEVAQPHGAGTGLWARLADGVSDVATVRRATGDAHMPDGVRQHILDMRRQLRVAGIPDEQIDITPGLEPTDDE